MTPSVSPVTVTAMEAQIELEDSEPGELRPVQCICDIASGTTKQATFPILDMSLTLRNVHLGQVRNLFTHAVTWVRLEQTVSCSVDGTQTNHVANKTDSNIMSWVKTLKVALGTPIFSRLLCRFSVVNLLWHSAGSCSDLDTHSVYAGLEPPPMVQQQQLQPLVHCNSMSSEEGRLASEDMDTKADQYLYDGVEQLINMK